MVQYPQGHAVACTCTTYTSAAKPRALCLLNHHSASVEPLACDVAAHFTNVKCECGIISTRHVCEQTVWQNERREGACPFRIKFLTTFGGSKPRPTDKPSAAQARQKLCFCGCGIVIAGKFAKQIFTASLSCALRSCIIDGFAKMPLQASIFASWYNENEFGNTDNRRKF